MEASAPTQRMNPQAEPRGSAWQPLTFGGVAAFARASNGRLWLTELVAALVSTASMIWFLAVAWSPVLVEAINRLPDQGMIRLGKLEWGGASPVVLAKRSFLAIGVDLEGTGQTSQPADLQLRFGLMGLSISSIFGDYPMRYPRDWVLALNRTELEPWWGAWRPVLFTGAGAVTFVGLGLMWGLLAALYAVPVKLAAWVLGRQLSWAGGWRLASAALMPGSLCFSAAILLYGLQRLDLIGLTFAFGLHWVIGWVYLVVAPLWLPHCSPAPARPLNPFTEKLDLPKGD